MVVSFVNAGLLSLTESIGVIMGANIGTTVTAWLISILGFKVSMAKVALPLVGIVLPLLFSKNRAKKSWGELIMGFALLFIGLDFLKSSVPDISSNSEMLGWLANFSEWGYGSYLLFMAIGTILTIVIQSSSATMALTLVMCNNGWITYDIAAAMVLGENIGTTITANLAALVANTSAKRTARAHLIFNLFGVVWMLLIFPHFIHWVADISMQLGNADPFASSAGVPITLSLFHTMFNVLNTLFLIFFTKFIAKTVIKLVPDKGDDDEVFALQHIKIGLLSTPEASLFLAHEEIALYGQRVSKMYGRAVRLFSELGGKKFDKFYSKLEKNEDACNRIEVEIANYLTKVGENRLSARNSRVMTSMFKLIDNLESIGDSSFNIARTISRAQDKKIKFPDYVKQNIEVMFGLVNDTLEIMVENMRHDGEIDLLKSLKKEKEVNNFRDILKKEHMKNLEKGMYDYNTGIIYNDIFSECEKLADYVINISESLEKVEKR
jgi:phosphate:Na+ symporter